MLGNISNISHVYACTICSIGCWAFGIFVCLFFSDPSHSLSYSLFKRWAVWIKEHVEFSWFKYKSYELEFFKYYFYLCVWMFWMNICLCTTCVPDGKSKCNNSEPLEMELQTMSVLGMEPVPSERAASILYSWAISPFSELDFYVELSPFEFIE